MTHMLLAASPDTVTVTAAAADTWHSRLVDWTVEIGFVFITLGMLFCIYRLLRGPHLADRALALDTMAIQLIGLVLLLIVHLDGKGQFLEGVMVLSLLGFAGTVAMAQYIARPHVRKRRAEAAEGGTARQA